MERLTNKRTKQKQKPTNKKCLLMEEMVLKREGYTHPFSLLFVIIDPLHKSLINGA